jgi:2-haloacid dehalogenase
MAVKAFVFDAYGTLYDVQSVAAATEAAFPGHGTTITPIWRLKQLEYAWLRSMMGRYEDFGVVTRESLRYTLDTLGLAADASVFETIVGAYETLTPYPDAEESLGLLKSYRLAILSNGSPPMLDALVRHSGFDRYLEAVISADAAGAYKPDPRVYALVEERLGLAPREVVFVTGNGFDTAGAASFGLRVARIERVASAALTEELAGGAPIGPAGMFRALRMRSEALGFGPDVVVGSLRDLVGAVQTLNDTN